MSVSLQIKNNSCYSRYAMVTGLGLGSIPKPAFGMGTRSKLGMGTEPELGIGVWLMLLHTVTWLGLECRTEEAIL